MMFPPHPHIGIELTLFRFSKFRANLSHTILTAFSTKHKKGTAQNGAFLKTRLHKMGRI